MVPPWLWPLLATFSVSIIPVLLLSVIPFLTKLKKRTKSIKSKKQAEEFILPLNTMLCFAAGSLLADSLHHLLEEASHSSELQKITINVLLGVLLFFLVDRISRMINHHDHPGMATGWLSLIADAVHNFTDGLAIAASFGKSIHSGAATTIAIFLHEIPHELGDYALLTKAGFDHAKIIKAQLLTGAAAFAGTALGISIQNGGISGTVSENSGLLQVTCGGFLYLALCTILPEVMGDHGEKTSLRSLATDSAALITGAAIIISLENYF